MAERLGGIKIRAVCDVLEIDPRTARLLVNIHGLTHGGENLDKLQLKEGETAEQRMGPLAIFLNKEGYLAQQARDVKRLLEDSAYREEMLKLYQDEILPGIRTMGFRDILHALTSTNLSKY